jgi:hypothetical protein
MYLSLHRILSVNKQDTQRQEINSQCVAAARQPLGRARHVNRVLQAHSERG